MISATGRDTWNPSCFATCSSRSAAASVEALRKSNRWVRLTMVAGILWGSVVASTNRTPGGGSSKSFSSASNASRDSRWASSRM